MLTDLMEALGRLGRDLADGLRPEVVESYNGAEFAVAYDTEKGVGEYAILTPKPTENGFGPGILPANVYAETEDGTYGVLQGFRIYLADFVEGQG